jgi:uncharacterized membrane protein
MRGIYRFLKATLLGGVGILLPLTALLAIVAWAGNLAIQAILPMFEWLPDKSVGGVSLTVLVAFGALLALCFVTGLVAQTAIVSGLGDRAEKLAIFIPGYTLMKNVGANIVGVEGKHPVRTALVRFEVTWQFGFLMETLADGRLVVFVPGVPRALVGTLHIFTPDRVQLLEMSVSTAMDVLSKLGYGLQKIEAREIAGGTV